MVKEFKYMNPVVTNCHLKECKEFPNQKREEKKNVKEN